MLSRLRPRRSTRLGRGWTSPDFLRRVVALTLFAVAGMLALQTGPAAAGPTSAIVVAARDVDVGHTLTADDLRTIDAPENVVPQGALTNPRRAVGKILTSAARTGEPITDVRLLGRGKIPGGRNMSAVPVRLEDAAVAQVLKPGMKVDVVTADDSAGGHKRKNVVARNASVLTVTASDGGVTAGQSDRLVVIALPEKDATLLASTSLNKPVTVTLR